MSRRKNQFSQALQKEFPFLTSSKQDLSTVTCSKCGCKFSIANKGRSDILQHVSMRKHQSALDRSSSSVSQFFRPAFALNDATKRLLVAEGTFAYHTVRHNQSFRSMDCSNEIIKDLFDKKYACARTKAEAIVVNVFAPFAIEEFIKDLKSVNYISVCYDASNHGDIKIVPIMARYFCSSTGVSTKILEVQDVPRETATVLSDYIMDTLKKHGLSSKVVGLSADNTNSNFGGAARKGQCNVFRKLCTEFHRDLIGVGCSAHILNNAVKSACNTLPVDIEHVLMKLLGHFQHHTVRVTALQQFCEDADVEYHKVLGYCATRWLSLLPSVERVLQIYTPLKQYFLDCESCPKALKDLFSSNLSEAWLLFVHSQAASFHHAIAILEADDICIVDAAIALKELRESLEARKSECFLPFAVKASLRSLEDGELEVFKSSCIRFYDSCINHINKWCGHFQRMEPFEWALLRSPLSWTAVEASIAPFQELVGEVDDSALFDDVRRVTLYADARKVNTWNGSKASTPQRWCEVLQHFTSEHITCTVLTKIVELLFCLPGTNAVVERVFSHMTQTWTKEKSNLKVDTLKALLITKCNFGLRCRDFAKLLGQSPQLLQRIQTSEKY